jgi:hypothetical protein
MSLILAGSISLDSTFKPYELIQYCRENLPGSSLSSRRAPWRQTLSLPLPGIKPGSPASQAVTLPKGLSRQLIRLLFGSSTWLPECMWRHTWAYLEAVSSSYVERFRTIAVAQTLPQQHQRSCRSWSSRGHHHYRETWPVSSLSSRKEGRLSILGYLFIG